MNKQSQILTGLFIAQLGLVAFTWWPASGTTVAPHALISATRDQVTDITITPKAIAGTQAENVHLVREGAKWVVASSEGYPATAAKVDEMLDKLLALRVTEPMASSPASFDSLKVGETEYGKKVDLVANGLNFSLIIGAGSASSIHVRVAGTNDVFEGRGLSEWSIAGSNRQYLDSEYAKIDTSKLGKITLARPDLTLTFTKSADAWSVDGLDEGFTSDRAKIASFIDGLSTITMTDVAGKEAKPEHGLADGVKLAFYDTNGAPLVPAGDTVGKIAESSVYIQADSNSFVIKANKSPFESLNTTQAGDFASAPVLTEDDASAPMETGP